MTDSSLVVDISDALSEKDKVKFTVHTRTTMKNFQKPEFLVVRQHEEFIWLHDRYEEEPKYAGYIVSLKNLFLHIFCNLEIILKNIHIYLFTVSVCEDNNYNYKAVVNYIGFN